MATKDSIEALTDAIHQLTLSHEQLKAEVIESNKTSKALSEKFETHSDRLSLLEKEIFYMRNQARAKNIILFKLKDVEEHNADLFPVILEIFQKIKLNIPETAIDEIYRLGKIKGSRPVIIKFVACRWVKLVFTKVAELNKLNLAIANDRTKEEREKRRLLLSKVNILKEQGKNIVLKSSNIILLNDSIISETEMENLLERNGAVASTEPSNFQTLTSKSSRKATITKGIRGRPPKNTSTHEDIPVNRLDKYLQVLPSDGPNTRSRFTSNT